MKSVLIIIILLLAGCSTTSNPDLLKGELFINETRTDRRHIIQTIELDEDNIYSITIRFR